MKFGKRLSSQIEETLPEWRDKFLSYKELKKRLKLFGEGGRPAKRPRAADAAAAVEDEEGDFLELLEAELEKFNSFFVEKEEECVIRQKELQDIVSRVVGKGSKEELMKVRKEIVDFHGEMVLLENYSALNYTGLGKILKKYEKRTGTVVRLPFIQKVLQQPFFTTDLIYKMVKECEVMLDRFFHKNEPPCAWSCGNDGCSGSACTGGRGGGRGGVAELEYVKSHHMKRTVAALRSLKEIRSGSSTVSVFSLPPLQSNGRVLEEPWCANELQVV